MQKCQVIHTSTDSFITVLALKLQRLNNQMNFRDIKQTQAAEIKYFAVNVMGPSDKDYRSEEDLRSNQREEHQVAHFVPEQKLVPADEDLSEPLENLGAVDLLVADELRADKVKNLGANMKTKQIMLCESRVQKIRIKKQDVGLHEVSTSTGRQEPSDGAFLIFLKNLQVSLTISIAATGNWGNSYSRVDGPWLWKNHYSDCGKNQN